MSGTEMIRYECSVCEMTATNVDTPASTLAWHTHMMAHARRNAFRSWTWAIQELDLDLD